MIGIAVLSSGNGCLSPNMYNLGILVVTLSWTNLIFFLSKLPIAGVYALTFVSIVRTFLKLALFAIFLLIGSTDVLISIFSNPLTPVSYTCTIKTMLRHYFTFPLTYIIC